MTYEPVGLTRDLPAQRVMRAQIGAADIAIWRSRSGKLAAWENRCPHRGMRLSHGFVRGEALACLYHGWHYNGQGTCSYIPAHPDLEPPKTICAVSYPVIEQDGVMWVSVADAPQPVSVGDGLQPVRSLTFECELERVLDAMAALPVPDPQGDPVTISLDQGGAVARTANGACVLRVLLQSPAPGQVTAHVLADARWDTEALIAVSRWAEAARRLAEGDGDIASETGGGS